MTTPIKTNHRSLVALDLPHPVPALLTYTNGIVTAMTGNPSFTSPIPSLPILTAASNGLRDAQVEAEARVRGAVLARNEKKTALIALLQQLKGYIQSIADANIENGASIIASAGVAVKKRTLPKPRVFAARPGKVSGSVELVAAVAARRASYEWASSADGGKTWTPLPSSLQAKTTITGLTPGSTFLFRYKAVTKTGEGDWSAPVSLTLVP